MRWSGRTVGDHGAPPPRVPDAHEEQLHCVGDKDESVHAGARAVGDDRARGTSLTGARHHLPKVPRRDRPLPGQKGDGQGG